MTKADLVEQVANATGLTKRDVGVVVDLLLETISKALTDKEKLLFVEWVDLGWQ